jgi:hypothetical protein
MIHINAQMRVLVTIRKLSRPLSSMDSNVTPSIPGAPSLPFAIE